MDFLLSVEKPTFCIKMATKYLMLLKDSLISKSLNLFENLLNGNFVMETDISAFIVV